MTDENVELSIPVEGEKPIQDRIDTLSPSSPQDSGSISTLPPEVKSSTSTQPQQEELKSDNIQRVITPEKKAGRPCEYCVKADAINKVTIDYLNTGKGEKPKMVFINELAMLLGCYKDIIIDWKNKTLEDGKTLEHPIFHRLVRELESMQELRLQQRLLGRYNPTGAIFLLKTKHKYIETEKQVIAGDANEPLNINIVEEKPLPK